jgi:very-short-patch-repair endonuclease
MSLGEIPEVAKRQGGTFSRMQAYDEGWSERQVRRRLASGRWKVVGGKALGAKDLDLDAWALAYAVVLSWPGAVVSHQVAAGLRGWPVKLGIVGTATVPHARGLAARGLRAYRSELADVDMSRFRGLRVTTERRTAVDLLGTLPWDQSRNLWAWLVTRQVVTAAQLEASVDARAGKHGVSQLRRLIAASSTGSLSAAEDRLHQLLGAAGIDGWRANVPIRVGGRIVAVVDVLFESHRLVIEVDGWRSHGDREAFQRDRTKQNRLVAHGYTVLRFTWEDLTARPADVVREIRRCLASGPF